MTQQITCSAHPLPIDPTDLPIEVTVCLKEPGTLNLSWSPAGQQPTQTTMTADDLCTSVYIPANTLGLVLLANGAPDLRVV